MAVGAAFQEKLAATSRPLVLGHRGASAACTENTLAAFARAMADGADGVELDVQLCRSGEVVVFHDDDLRRLAGRPDRVGDVSFGELRQVVLAGGGVIPTLAEALSVCGTDALVNVELKYDRFLPAGCRALVDAVADEVSRTAAGHQVLISSFSPAAIWLWRRRRPDVPCGLLFEQARPFRLPWPLPMDRLLPLLRPAAAHPQDRLCTPAAMARWRRRGLAVNVWTVDDPARIRALAAMGASGVITNDPAGARRALSLTP